MLLDMVLPVVFLTCSSISLFFSCLLRLHELLWYEVQYILRLDSFKVKLNHDRPHTLRNYKFSSNKICSSTGIILILAESFNKM